MFWRCSCSLPIPIFDLIHKDLVFPHVRAGLTYLERWNKDIAHHHFFSFGFQVGFFPHLMFEFYKGNDRRIHHVTWTSIKTHDNAFQLYSAIKPNLQVFVQVAIFIVRFSFNIYSFAHLQRVTRTNSRPVGLRDPVDLLTKPQTHFKIKPLLRENYSPYHYVFASY